MEEDPEDTFAEVADRLAVALDCWATDNFADAITNIDEAVTILNGLREKFNQKLES